MDAFESRNTPRSVITGAIGVVLILQGMLAPAITMASPASSTSLAAADEPLRHAASETAAPCTTPGYIQSRQSCKTGPNQAPSGSSHNNAWIPWAIMGVIGAAAIASKMPAQAKATDQSLVQSGPRFPDHYSVGTFAVQGYTRSGWPIVVDFLPEPSSLTSIEIAIDGQLRYEKLLDASGERGRQLVKLVLPADLADRPVPAVYAVHSVRFVDSRVVKDANGNDVPSPVEIFGIGAGPKAVGSVAVDDVQFGPSPVSMAGNGPREALYSYNVRSPFNHAVVEILKFASHDGEIEVEPVANDHVPGLNLGRTEPGRWNGTGEDGHTPSFGLHRLQVRAWFGASDAEDLSWVGAWSPNAVMVSQ